MDIQGISALLETVNASLVVLLCHHNADPDAVCAAFAFSSLLKRFRPNLQTEIGAAEGPSRLSKHILAMLSLTLTPSPRIEGADAIVLLDTNTIQQLNSWAERVRTSNSPIVVVDHHASHPETERLATLSVSDENASSTCEIVYRFFKDVDIEFTQREAELLFLGIAFDTRHFVLADSTTFKIVADLVDSGVNARDALGYLSLPMKESERIARLKASKRAKMVEINGWILALSHVGAYQASAARALIALGAHIAIVVGQKNGKLKISLRASQDFYRSTNVHLGREVAKPLGKHFGGMGGGHAISAGANGIGEPHIVLERGARLVKEKLAVK